MDYFKRQLELLQMERAEDQQSYTRLWESASVADRRTIGISWYPVAIKGTEIGRGDYLTVELERTTHHDLPHQFRFGMSAALFSNHDAKQDRIQGVIAHQNGNKLSLTIGVDDLPDWSQLGKLGVDLMFDDNSYDAMQEALRTAGKLVENTADGKLIRVMTGDEDAAFDPETALTALPELNASQQAAVRIMLSAKELAIVHGPPGTGKTTTLVQGIKALYARDKNQLLVVAPSNTAVDLLSEKLSALGMKVLRIGNPARVSERLMSLTLDHQMQAHPRIRDIKNAKKQANAFKDMAHKYKRNFGKAEREQRKALFTEAHRIMKDVANTEQYIQDDLIAKAQVITATLVGATHYTIRKRIFHTAVIDEAGQALEPACWIPITKAKKIIMAGDHCQLPPTIKSVQAARSGLGITLFEKSIQRHPKAVILLDEQYRMHETIMGFPSAEFYGGKLHANARVATALLMKGEAPLEFIDTAGAGFEEKQTGTSIFNPEEAAFLIRHLANLVTRLREDEHFAVQFPSVAVIAPYKEQVQVIKELLQHHPVLLPVINRIAVNTVDGFQGQEREIVFISLTRSNAEGSIGFLSDIRRMNVAMTRARKKLVMIGDSATLSSLPFYADLVSYAEKQQAYHSSWDYVEE